MTLPICRSHNWTPVNVTWSVTSSNVTNGVMRTYAICSDCGVEMCRLESQWDSRSTPDTWGSNEGQYCSPPVLPGFGTRRNGFYIAYPVGCAPKLWNETYPMNYSTGERLRDGRWEVVFDG